MEESTAEPDNSIEKDHAFLLSMQFGVLRQILSYLPARDLGQAALVCHAWNDVCRILRRERQTLYWFEWHSTKGASRSRGIAHTRRSLINDEFGRVYSEPQLCLFFLSSALLSNPYDDAVNDDNLPNETQNEVQVPAMRHLVSMLPRKCTALGLEVFGTVGTPWNLGTTIELEKTAALSALLIPKITGVKVRHFTVGADHQRLYQLTSRKKLLSDVELEELTGIPPGEDVRCLLILSSYSTESENVADLIIRTLLERIGNRIAIGGGCGENYLVHPSVNGTQLMGVAISGSSVKAISAIIRPSVTKRASIDQVMKKLKSCQVPSENCVGFMFSCMGRYSRRGKNGVGLESSLFRNHFPAVPLIGFFGSGEIGVDYLTRCDSQGENSVALDICYMCGPSAKKSKEKGPKLMHEYTTVIVLVSLGKGKVCHNVSNVDT